MNQPLSVQPWGRDGYKRRYWLIEGQDDTHFRVYRENSGITNKSNQWFSVASNIDEANALADKLYEEGTSTAKVLTTRIRAAIPRFEASEEVCWPNQENSCFLMKTTEAKTTRLPPQPQSGLCSSRTWILPIRRSDSGQEDALHILRRRRLGRLSQQKINEKLRHLHSCGTRRPNGHS